jgi:enoyl-CoA hydratase
MSEKFNEELKDHKADLFYKVENQIATVYFNRPEKRNAIHLGMWEKIPKIMRECDENKDVKVIIFRGIHDNAFSAGADISEFKRNRNTADGAEYYNRATLIAEESVQNVSKPTIAMIQGFCVGGGCEIAVACDFRFSDENGKFGITPSKLGLIYNTPGTKNLVDLVGPSHAKDILYTGRIIEAEEALQMGLVNKIIPAEEIEAKTVEYANTISRNAQYAVRGSKRIINQVLKGAHEDSPEIAELVISSFISEDYREGVNAFLEKRKPNFQYS